MPTPGGQYVVVTRAPGTQITALIYNNDHQNHVDGRSALEMGAFGITLSQYQLAENPLPGGVESLPPSLGGEITRLRFVLAQIISQLSGGASVNWYDALTSPGFATIGARILVPSTITIPNNFGTTVSFSGGTIAAHQGFNSGVWSNSVNPSRFTAPVAGKYLTFITTQWNNNGGAGRRQLQVAINGVSAATDGVVSNFIPTGGAAQFQSLTSLVKLAAADYVEFFAFQNSGASLNLGAGSTSGGIVFLGT